MQYNIIQYNIMQLNALQYNSHYNDNLFIQLPMGKRNSADPSMRETYQKIPSNTRFQAEVSRKWTSISEHNEGSKEAQPRGILTKTRVKVGVISSLIHDKNDSTVDYIDKTMHNT